MLGTLRKWFAQEEPEPPVWPPPMPVMGPRSPEWDRCRDEFLMVSGNGFCAVCSSKDRLEVHHVRPFHRFPRLELDFDNLITFCRPCHFVFGHCHSWLSWNPWCRQDAKDWAKKIRERP